ncbi:MAG: hypothetical protein AB7H77_07240, partial [Bdellovibrionales bacterium]
DGGRAANVPSAGPHVAFLARNSAEQLTNSPPGVLQVHVHGPLPLTADAVPLPQRPAVGADIRFELLAEPQVAVLLLGPVTPRSSAEHVALPPPPEPRQVHVHGPVPEMADGVPLPHRPPVGGAVRDEPLADPHVPFLA